MLLASFSVSARTVSVATQTETSVTLTFGDADGLDYGLFLAHGATDGGEDKGAWDAFEKVADIAGDATSYTYEVPAALRDGRPMRFFLMQTIGVNMAKEYTFIRSTGAQWIDTGAPAVKNWIMDFRFRTGALQNDKTFFGQHWGGNNYLFILQEESGTTKFRFYGNSPQTVSTPVADTDYRLVIDPANYLTLTGGGSETRKSTSRESSTYNFSIFADRSGGHPGAYTFYRMKIAANYTPVYDFVPAANAAGDIGLYDNVNDVFHPNKTATPLVAGDELPPGRFGRVLDETPTFRFQRSVSVAAATADAVTLSFANPDGAAYTLYVASGAADCEDRKNDWDSFEEVATIAADATSFTYTLPAALKADGVCYRFFLAKTGEMPYAAELASLTSTGAQLVRLDYVPGYDTTTDFRFGGVTYEEKKVFFGQHWGSNAYLFNMQSSEFRFHGSGKSSAIAPASGTDYRCRITADDQFSLENAADVSAITESRKAYPLIDMCVFADHRGVTYNAKFRFDSMRVKDGGLLVRDLVPVKTAAGKGALFDRASGQVFENVTATDFTLGAAAARPAWVVAMTGSLAGSASAAPSALLDRITLTEDTEWSALAGRLAGGATVDLNGHALHVSATDAAALSAPVTLIGASGTFRITVPAGQTWDGSTFRVLGSLAVVKDGPGTWQVESEIYAATSLAVEEGVVKMGVTLGIAEDTPVTVAAGAAFDFAGYSNNIGRFTIAGDGPDGKGALRNSGANISNKTRQLKSIALSDDATIGGSGNFGLIYISYGAAELELNGHTLTVDMDAGKSFWFCHTSGETPGTVFVKSGAVHFSHKSHEVSLPEVDFVVDGAAAVFNIPANNADDAALSYAKKIIANSATVRNGGSFKTGYNVAYFQRFFLGDGALVPNTAVRWIYVADTVTVSNETSDVTIYPPFTANDTYPRLVKKGAGALTIANNHTDQRIDRGVEIFGGTVVMSTSRTSGGVPHKAISSQAVPVTIHSGGTLDVTQCTSPMLITTLNVEEGGTILNTAGNAITIQSAVTFPRPQPFAFAGKVNFTASPTFALEALFAGVNAPAAGSTVTLFEAGEITASNGVRFNVTGCPYDYDILVSGTAIKLKTKTDAEAALTPIKIWTVGGNFVYGSSAGNTFRIPLASLLSQEGWPVKMTGWRTASASGVNASSSAWSSHAGIPDLALKTSATRAGLLEGLETYAAAANEPDFTILVCGDIDVADGVADARVLANYKAVVTRIKAVLPMTTVLASTIPGAGAELNADIAAWCATESDVECVDLASVMTTAITAAECDAAAALLKAKLMTLATASGKNTPSTWTRPAVTLGAENNVPVEYRAGYTRVRTMEPSPTLGYARDLYAIPYSYAPPMKETGITKVAYYVELVRKDTGALQALWVDMDAPGSTWADVAFPVTTDQSKHQSVTKLHVWSNFGGVSSVPANDDTVEGYIEFHPLNYAHGGSASAADSIAEPWENAVGFYDTFNTTGDHACFQLMRKFADADAFPAGEILFAYNNWGKTAAGARAIGMGTLANYAKIGVSNNSNRTLDWTFIYDAEGTDLGNISSPAYSHIRIDFWVQYDDAPVRADLADAVWSGATDAAFATPGNWTAGESAATTLAGSTILIPQDANPTFTYIGYDPVSLSTTTLMADGTATFPEVGGIYLASLDMGATGKLVYDPTKFTFRLVAPPTFASGAKIALTSNYAANTNGRFLLMTWDNGALEMADADLTAVFDTASASGSDVKVWAENLESGGGRLWLDLDYSTPKQRMNVLCVGDSITQGNDSSYGNWRTGLMKKLAAAGYAPVAKGFWTIHSHDICGATMPDEWIHHSGISGQRIITGGSGGTVDAIEATLDQAGDIDFVLVKLGTNDINNGRDAETTYYAWTNLVWKTLNQKPHVKFIAGAVVDIAYTPAKDAQVVAFNTMVRNAIEGGLFPAKRAYFADLYTPCYRYDSQGNYIVGSFNSASNLHPDWPGEDKMADVYCAAILGAIADDAGFELNAAETGLPTTSGAENNVPAEYRAGFTRARVLDVAANSGVNLTPRGFVPYAVENAEAPVADLSRVGYYIELKRRNDAQSDFHGLTRWIWVSMDAFGGRTIDDVAVPLTTVNQRVVRRLRVKTNMPGIESTAADAVGVDGWVEFWPNTYNEATSGLADAPAHTYGLDWNDIRTTGNYGSMQVHRFTPGATNPAQVLFAFNRWMSSGADNWEIGIGNFSHRTLASVDWTFTGAPDKASDMTETMSAAAYEVARIEIWTASAATDADVPGASVRVDNVVSDGGAVTVSGTLADFGMDADSAALTLEWSADPAFATVTGSQSLGTFTELGTVTNTVAGLATGTDWYFRFTSVNGNGTTAVSAVSDPYSLNGGYWRPQTTGDNWTSVAWLKNDAGSPVAFNPLWTAIFDGTESTKTATVTVPEEVAASQVRVEGASDYTLAGAGSIAAQRLVKDGAGTLTLDAAVLAQTPDIEVRGGTVKLADDAMPGAAGKDGGTITVKSGGQFDFNYNDTVKSSGTTRAKITSGKTFVIEGDGPDGEGALITSYASEIWGSQIDELRLSGDATVGGSGRLTVRDNTKNLVTGPTNATLTVASHGSGDYGFGIVDGTLDIGRLSIPATGKFLLQGAVSLTIPYGIDLYGLFRLYGENGTWNVGGITARGANAVLGNNNGTSYVRTPILVEEGATLTLNGSATTTYEDTVTNRSTIAITSGTHQFYGDLVNEGNPVIRASKRAVLNFPTVTGDSRAEVSGDQFRLSGVTDWGDSALDVTLSGSGNFVFGVNNDGYGYPKFQKNKLSATAASGHSGVFYLYSNLSDSFDGITVGGLLGGFRAQGPNNGAVISCIDSNLVFSTADMRVGTKDGRGEHVFAGPETSVSATALQFGYGAKKKEYHGMLDFSDGLLAIGADGITAYWRHPGRPLFVMSGGTLRAAADFAITLHGLTCDFGGPTGGGAVTFDLNGKTVKWGTGLTGGSDVTITGEGAFTPDRPGLQGIPTGRWTVESAGTVDLRNAAGFAGGLSLAEGASATLDIAGTNMLEAVAWTWYGTPNAWDTMLPLYTNKQVVAPHLATSLTFLNRKASKVRDIKRLKDNGAGEDTSGAGFNFFGQFYVSEAQAGTWGFTHACKTHSGVIIDGTQYTSAGVGKTGTFTVDLAAGWHDFMISAYSNATDPNIGANSGSEAFKFKAPGDSDYTVFDVTTVPMRMSTNLCDRTSVRWRTYQAGTNSVSEFATADESKFSTRDVITNSLQLVHQYANIGTNALLRGAVSRFDGYFRVTEETAGNWTFSANFADRVALSVDGRRLIASTSDAERTARITLREGWHTFDIRTADDSEGTSGDVGGKLTDVDGNVCAIRFKVNNGDYHAFDERYVAIAHSAHGTQKFEQPGLGGVIELAAGSSITNAPREGGWCPIYGTVKGAGTLAGPFRFTGDDNCWEISGNQSSARPENTVTFADADAQTFAGLKRIQITFNGKPQRSYYSLADAVPGLTSENVGSIALEVSDTAGNDYSDGFSLLIDSGRLLLRNAHPAGFMLFIR